jgi:aldose 1-epimerase
MSGFEVAAADFGTGKTLVVTHAGTGLRVVIAHQGATLLQWTRQLGGKPVELLDGYNTPAELETQDGVRNGVLAPFPNRVAGARYHFDNEDHDLQPGVADDERLFYHGLLRTMVPTLTDVVSSGASVSASFKASIRPGAFPGYPFAVDVQTTYVITTNGLRLEVAGHNVGDRPAPFASGWHPYYRLGDDGINNLELTVPASQVIQTDDALIPRPGREAYAFVETNPSLDYRPGRKLDGAVLDACFTDLTHADDGHVHTVLRNPSTQAWIDVWQSTGHMHVFTGDTLRRDRRKSVALEPVEVMTDAFNRSDAREAITLQPGQSRSFICGVDVHTQ